MRDCKNVAGYTTRPLGGARATVISFGNVASISRIRFLLGSILLVSAALKAESLFSSPTTFPWYLAVGLVLAELALAGFLFSGAMPRQVWWAAALCFSGFAIVAGVKMWRGEADCGCFGAVATPPWVALAIDLAALGALLLKYPDRSMPRQATDSRLPIAIAFALIAIVGIKTAASISSVQPTLAGIDPTGWVGGRLPALSDIDVRAQIETGQWEILFHRPGCGQCEKVFGELIANDRRTNLGRLAIIQLPPSDEMKANTKFDGIVTGNLHGDAYAMLPAPLLVQLTDGVVEAVIPLADINSSRGRLPAIAYTGDNP